MPRLSLATVYKALDALVAAGVAARLTDGAGTARYDGRAEAHYHFRCARTGAIVDLPLHYDPPINDPAELQVELEPQAEGPGLVPCWLQKQPAHKLVNLQNIPVLDVSAEASYHRVFDSCVPKWLKQAGVNVTYTKLEDVGLPGNAHEMMLEKNSDGIARYFESWIEKNVH